MMVYKHTNLINGKVYIGRTVRSAAFRLTECCYEAKKGSKTGIANAIRKYGRGSFKTETLYLAKSFYELAMMEQFFIVLHQSYLPKYGYNILLGGSSVLPNSRVPRKFTSEHCRKISEAEKGKIVSEEVKLKLKAAWTPERRQKHIARITGIKHSEERRRNNSLGQKRAAQAGGRLR